VRKYFVLIELCQASLAALALRLDKEAAWTPVFAGWWLLQKRANIVGLRSPSLLSSLSPLSLFYLHMASLCGFFSG